MEWGRTERSDERKKKKFGYVINEEQEEIKRGL